MFDLSLDVRRVKLSTGESVEAAEKGELIAATNQENFRIVWVGVVTQQDYCGRVSWLGWGECLHSAYLNFVLGS